MGAANLFAIVVLAAPVTLGLRRARPDLPKVVARDYSGTAAMCAITAVLLITGLVNRAHVQSDHNAMTDAIKRAQAYVGDRAPDQFKRDLGNGIVRDLLLTGRSINASKALAACKRPPSRLT